jgi:hypothetical protein
MVRRGIPEDPLKPRGAPTWLVVRNALSQVVEGHELEANANLRGILSAERDRRVAAGWDADTIGPRDSYFFCKKDGVRMCVHIERIPPIGPRATPAGGI